MHRFYRKFKVYRNAVRVWWFCRPRWSEMVVPERTIKMNSETSDAVREVMASMQRLSSSVHRQARQENPR